MIKSLVRRAARWPKVGLAILCLGFGVPTAAEQFKVFGDYTAHYVVINSSFLKPAVAHAYGIVRGSNKALLNISVLDGDGNSVAVPVNGTVKNLLGQVLDLRFKKVVDKEAIYFIATFNFDDRETLRFTVDIDFPEGRGELAIQQQMYADR